MGAFILPMLLWAAWALYARAERRRIQAQAFTLEQGKWMVVFLEASAQRDWWKNKAFEVLETNRQVLGIIEAQKGAADPHLRKLAETRAGLQFSFDHIYLN